MSEVRIQNTIIELNPILNPITTNIQSKQIDVTNNGILTEISNHNKDIDVMSFGTININISGGGVTETAETLQNVATYKLLASINGKVELADKDNPIHAFNIIGMSVSSGSEGSIILVQTGGTILNGNWTWNENMPLWLGNNGDITQTPPETGFLMQIGIALSPSKILLEIQEATQL